MTDQEKVEQYNEALRNIKALILPTDAPNPERAGCMDEDAINYDAEAVISTDTCIYKAVE